jgi:hypothetical protein
MKKNYLARNYMFLLGRFKKRILAKEPPIKEELLVNKESLANRENPSDKESLADSENPPDKEYLLDNENPADKEDSIGIEKAGEEGNHTAAGEEVEYEIVEKEILPEKMICPDCGGITLVGLDFCDKCGGELINHES